MTQRAHVSTKYFPFAARTPMLSGLKGGRGGAAASTPPAEAQTGHSPGIQSFTLNSFKGLHSSAGGLTDGSLPGTVTGGSGRPALRESGPVCGFQQKPRDSNSPDPESSPLPYWPSPAERTKAVSVLRDHQLGVGRDSPFPTG